MPQSNPRSLVFKNLVEVTADLVAAESRARELRERQLELSNLIRPRIPESGLYLKTCDGERGDEFWRVWLQPSGVVTPPIVRFERIEITWSHLVDPAEA
jgi:hypothetical protein